MHSPSPPRPSYPPGPGRAPGESDRVLAALIAAGDDGGAVALLLARHWRAAQDYAAICLASAGPAAQFVAAASVHRLLTRLASDRSAGALRPQLLVVVRDMVREWAGADGVPAELPELDRTIGARGLRAARAGTPERRRLAERAFQSLPVASQCLLWHCEVEAEPISVPAGLLGVDTITATAGLDQAREQFRAKCVRAHLDLAPTVECRFYHRLLDIPLRRGTELLPDVRDHLAQCRHCRHTAEQLSHFDEELAVLLAEAVLGWGARRYLDSRPGRTPAPPSSARGTTGRGAGAWWRTALRAVVPAWLTAPRTPAAASARRAAPPAPAGRHRGAHGARPAGPGSAASGAARAGRRAKAAGIGAGVATLALLVGVPAVRGGSGDNGVPGPEATWGAPVGDTVRPAAPGEPHATGASSSAAVSVVGREPRASPVPRRGQAGAPR